MSLSEKAMAPSPETRDCEVLGYRRTHQGAGCYESELRSARFARRALAALPLSPRLRDKAELVLAELATNALMHGQEPFFFRVWYEGAWVRIEVEDGSPALPSITASSSGIHGRGLVIVDNLSTTWGTEHKPDGKVVWAELA